MRLFEIFLHFLAQLTWEKGGHMASRVILFVFALSLCSATFAAEPAFKPAAPPPGYPHVEVSQDGKTIDLWNRGRAVSTVEYANGADVTYEVEILEGGDKQYCDHVRFVFLTDGKVHDKRPHGVVKGVTALLNPENGKVEIEAYKSDASKVLAEQGGFTFQKNQKYKVVVSYTPTAVSVSVAGKTIKAEIPAEYRGGGNNCFFQNRELVAGQIMHTRITGLEIKKK